MPVGMGKSRRARSSEGIRASSARAENPHQASRPFRAASVLVGLGFREGEHAHRRPRDMSRTEKLRQELIESIAHDMQTPLATLQGMAQTLTRGEPLPAERQRELHQAMLRQTTRLQHLVAQFLDFTRIEAGQTLSFHTSPTDVAERVSLIASTFGHGNPIDVDVPPDLPPAFVDGDRLAQVLANLISNAVKFSPSGSAILVSAHDRGDELELVVSDHGSGMSETELSRAFEKFYRGNSAPEATGTGLGLYISREIVEGQGGSITAASRPGEGCRITVRLPKTPEPGGT
jgi:signal transduction histidine kinase